MKRFTQEQIDRANSVDLVELIRSRGYAFRPIGGEEHCLLEHDSLKFNHERWNWFSRKTGGKPIDFLVKYEGMSFVDAVYFLLGEKTQVAYRPKAAQHEQKVVEEKPKKLMLPPKADNEEEAFAYLHSRGLPMDLIQQCSDELRLYQADTYLRRKEDGTFEELPGKQVVFVGYDKDYTPRYASMRSLQGSGKHEAYGSDKSYAFTLPGPDACKVLWVFESAIDAMSHAALCRMKGNNPWPAHRIALGGLSTRALERFLQEHPAVRYINLGLDADEPGRKAAAQLVSSLADRYIVFDHPPKYGKDYNEELLHDLRIRSRNPAR